MSVTAEIMQDVIRVITRIQNECEAPTVACDNCGVAYSTFDKYTKSVPELALLRKEAEDRLYDSLADKLLTINTDMQYGSTDAKMASVLSRNIQWVLSRRRQAAYGDKITNEHVIKADREVLSALQAAKARAHGVGRALPAAAVQTLVADASGVMRPETPEEALDRELAALA